MTFLLMNLQCSPQNAGKTVDVLNTGARTQRAHAGLRRLGARPDPVLRDAGVDDRDDVLLEPADAASDPSSAQNPQTQLITKVMPVMFGIFGFAFPAGLVLYWTVSNGFQIGQQAIMLRLGHIGPEAMDRRLSETKAKAASKSDKPRSGFMGRSWSAPSRNGARRQPDTPPPCGSRRREAPGRVAPRAPAARRRAPRAQGQQPEGEGRLRPTQGVGTEPTEAAEEVAMTGSDELERSDAAAAERSADEAGSRGAGGCRGRLRRGAAGTDGDRRDRRADHASQGTSTSTSSTAPRTTWRC